MTDYARKRATSWWRRFAEPMEPETPLSYPPPPPPAPERDQFQVQLASAVEGAVFQVRFTYEWSSDDDPDRIRSQIRQRLQRWAGQKAAALNVTYAQNLENDLNAALSRTSALDSLRIRRGSVTVWVSDEALGIGAEWDTLSHRRAVDRLRRQIELEELHFLRDEIYSHPDVARGLWLKRHPDAVNDLLDDRFERLAARFRNTGHVGDDGAAEAHVARVVSQFIDGLNDVDRSYLLTQLARVFESYGREDLGEQLA